MANKSFASSGVGGEESHYGDPEYARDFNSAYSKVTTHFSFPSTNLFTLVIS
jgi:hypothetical protein